MSRPGATDAGALDQVGAYLRDVMVRSEDDRNFRIFCPDELESNKLGAVLEVTGRAHLWSDEADSRFTPDGRFYAYQYGRCQNELYLVEGLK